MLLEPVQGEGGVHVLPDELLRAAREACDEHGAALIFDEVQCGLGRTGPLWAYEHTGVVPDALTTAKALGGGLPIGALVTGPRLADVFEPGDHGSTFAGGPVGRAPALAVLDVIDDEALLARVRELGELLAAPLAELPARARGPRPRPDARRRPRRGRCAPSSSSAPCASSAWCSTRRARRRSALLPPLVVGDAEIDDALARLGRLLGA